MARAEAPSLRDYVASAPARFFWQHDASVCFTDLVHGTSLGGGLKDLAGRSVLLATASQLTAALALIELDGCARRITILPPDAEPGHLGALIETAEIDAVVVEGDAEPRAALELPVRVGCAPSIVPANAASPARLRTEWVLLTSGTTGVPKMVMHSLAGLTAAIRSQSPADG